MNIYVIKCPSGEWLSHEGKVMPFADMAAAQMEILQREPDIVAAGRWQIHPVSTAGAGDGARLKVHVAYKLKKYDAETGELLETITGEG